MKIFNLFIPAICHTCNRRISSQRDCLCDSCASLLKRGSDELYGEKDLGKRYFDKAFGLYQYDYLTRTLLHNFKYHSIRVIGKYLSERAVEALKSDYHDLLDIDYTLAVPMHKSRENSFNHAHIISKSIAKALNIKDLSNAVVKSKYTDKQALLSYKDRITGPAGSFKVKKGYDFTGIRLLIIDDIFTTGATVNELSKVLKANGASKVYVFVMAAGSDSASGSERAKKKTYKRTINQRQATAQGV
jgi:ComF family protein